MAAHFIAIALGFFLDRIVGDPQNWPHPVRLIGSLISTLTKRLNKGKARVMKGTMAFFITVVTVTVIVLSVVFFSYKLHLFAGIVVESILIAVGLAQKSLKEAALEVYEPLIEGDMKEARKKLSWIVGRDTERLGESEIARGAIETVSENTADGITSPLFWAFLFGAPGLWMYKSVNTLDSMIGYRDERYYEFGKFSARADDVLNFIPARMTGLLILLFSPNEGKIPFGKRFAGWRKDARRHPSPNSGYLEAATAWQLGVKLGGESSYRGVISKRPEIGPNLRQLEAAHIQTAIVQMHRASFSFFLLMMLIGVVLYAVA